MEQELLYGMQDSNGVCAGFIGEIEISQHLTVAELRQLKAAAVVQKMTNAPLIVAETTPSRHAPKLLDVIAACDGELSRTVLSHMDMYTHDVPFLQSLLERGVTLCMDRFTISAACFDPDQIYPTIAQVVDAIHGLLKLNPEYCRQIVLSFAL